MTWLKEFKPIQVFTHVKKMVRLASITLLIVAASGLKTPAAAAGETGHSDLMRLMAAIYGLNLDVSKFLATINQSVDKVPLSAATQSGEASAKLHFPRVTTKSDLNERDLQKLLNNGGKRTLTAAIAAYFKNSSMGGGVASLSNAEAAEMMTKAMQNGDGLAFAMGLHYLLDVGGAFHDGYLGALNLPIPLLEKFVKLPLGHLSDGTSPDRLTVGKIILAMEAMGPFLIVLRETQKDAVGVNDAWLNQLKSQGVDVLDNESIMKWFFEQEFVAKIMKEELPSNRSELFVKTVSQDLRGRINQLKFFNDAAYLDAKLEEINLKANHLRISQDKNWTVNKLIYQLVDEAWRDGKLNEREVIKETVTDYAGWFEKTQRLDELLIKPGYESLPQYAQEAMAEILEFKSSHHPHTREWMVDQIVAKLTRGMIVQAWEKFNTAYFNPNTEVALKTAEAAALIKIEKHFFNRAGKYSYNPGVEYWKKVFQDWKAMDPAQKGRSYVQKIIAFSDLILKTKIYEGFEIHSPKGIVKMTIFFKTIAYLYKDEFRNPLTAKGNFAVKFRSLRDRIIAEIKKEFPNGLVTEETIAKSKAYNDFVNRKYNSDTPVGAAQKAAAAIVRMSSKPPTSGGTLSSGGVRCERAHTK